MVCGAGGRGRRRGEGGGSPAAREGAADPPGTAGPPTDTTTSYVWDLKSINSRDRINVYISPRNYDNDTILLLLITFLKSSIKLHPQDSLVYR